MRPCPTCDCFVPVAARRCPRCTGALEPVREEVSPERELARDPVLVGVGRRSSQANGSADAVAQRVVARLTLPPLDSPALRPRRPQLPKLPQPFAPDPLVLAVFLGIPPIKTNAEPEATNGLQVEPLTGSRNTFGALLGTAVDAPETARAIDDLLPGSGPAAPVLTPTPAPTVVATPLTAPAPVAVPLAASDIAVAATAAGVPGRRARRSTRDPFARSTTRRERVLARGCWTLAIALAVAVVMLRLPLGARPELGASSPTAPSTSSVTSSPFEDAIREQTHADLQAVVTTAQRLNVVLRSYVPATPARLNGYLRQFGFVTRTETSQRVGEMSVATSDHVLVLAEYAGPGQCAFARVVDQHTATVAGPTAAATCSAATTPQLGWTPLNP